MDFTDTQSVKTDVMMPRVDGRRLWRALGGEEAGPMREQMNAQ